MFGNIIDEWKKTKFDIYEDRHLYMSIFFIISILGIISLRISSELKINFDFRLYVTTLKYICYVTFLTWSSYYYIYLLITKTRDPIQVYIRVLINFFTPLSKALSFFYLVLAMNLVFSSHTFIKRSIPDINPFKYDIILYNIDKWIHFGYSPWQLTHELFSNAYLSLFINFLYHLWFLFLWGSTLFFIIKKSNLQLRFQYLISFMLCWVINGAIIATILSSAGPCYLYLLDKDNKQFLSLMQRLAEQSEYLKSIGLPELWALNVQDSLWQKYLTRSDGIGVGISAMPSMHVSSSVLMALGSYRVNKKLGILMWVFAVFIQIGSVHLGWHYAIDGYIGALLTIIIWLIIGKITTYKK